MKRREFIAALGSVAVMPLAARAQRRKIRTVGYLGPLTESAQRDWTAAFLFNMRRHGWVDGDTVAIVYRWAEGRTDRFVEIAAELVQLKVDVIVTAGTLATIAAKQRQRKSRLCSALLRMRLAPASLQTFPILAAT